MKPTRAVRNYPESLGNREGIPGAYAFYTFKEHMILDVVYDQVVCTQ